MANQLLVALAVEVKLLAQVTLFTAKFLHWLRKELGDSPLAVESREPSQYTVVDREVLLNACGNAVLALVKRTLNLSDITSTHILLKHGLETLQAQSMAALEHVRLLARLVLCPVGVTKLSAANLADKDFFNSMNALVGCFFVFFILLVFFSL